VFKKISAQIRNTIMRVSKIFILLIILPKRCLWK